MTLSDYLKILYPFYGGLNKQGAFTVNIFEMLMKEDAPNCFGKINDDYFQRIYNGTANLSPKRATTILSNLDEIRFADFIDSGSGNAPQDICDSIEKWGITEDSCNIGVRCADLLKDILTRISRKEVESQYKLLSSENSESQVVDKINTIQLGNKIDRGLLVTLLTESRGDCLCCNKKLGVPKKNQQSSDTSEIVYLKMNDSEESCYANAVVLCKNCAVEVDQFTVDEKNDLLNKKRDCADYVVFLTKLDNFKFQKEIETVLREINSNKNNGNLERSDPNDLVEISQKIHEPYLKEKINASMTRLYKKVKEICSRLEQEIGFDTEVFGSLMKSAQITLTNVLKTKPEIDNPQEYAIQLLQERLCSQVGQKHQDACLIIINYLIKRCDLFNETSKQS